MDNDISWVVSADELRSEPFCILSDDGKSDIVAEFVRASSNSALKKSVCSFCGQRELDSTMRKVAVDQIDIDLLTQAVDVLHRICVQPLIAVYDSATVVDGCYALCLLCRKETVRLECGAAACSGMYKFTRLLLRSYANSL
jgi:hypothetical protein